MGKLYEQSYTFRIIQVGTNFPEMKWPRYFLLKIGNNYYARYAYNS